MRLSEILRYQLYDCNTERVPIDKEIVFLKNYIELQRLRLNTNYNVAVDIGDDVNGFMIAPLLIMPLVENAFKYVSHFTTKANEIGVGLSFENGVFACEVFNTVEKQQSEPTNESGGIGLKNLRRRLDLLYPGRYEMSIDDNDQSFSVKLILKVNEDQLHNSGR
jgi:LytS/YehU family sensor histidine kinase